VERLEPALDLVERGAERPRERGSSQRVVDVVEARNAELDATPSFRRDQVERDALDPLKLDLASDDVERGAPVAAGRATVVAQVPDVGRGVVVGRPAPNAPLRIGGVLQGRMGVARIVDAEDCPRAGATLAAQVSDLRIV